MPAPGISSFGDGDHLPGAAGITVTGGNFGAFPGAVWIFENADRSGAADQLTVNTWNDLVIDVDIPGSLNNTAGSRFVAVVREDLAWSDSFGFTLSSSGRAVSAATAAIALTAQQATVGRAREVSAATEALAITAQAASVVRDRSVLVGVQAIAFTGQQASVGRGSDRQVTCATEAIAATGQAATVGRARDVTATTQALTITAQAATVGRSRSVLAQTEVLTFSAGAASVFRGVRSPPIRARTFTAESPRRRFSRVA